MEKLAFLSWYIYTVTIKVRYLRYLNNVMVIKGESSTGMMMTAMNSGKIHWKAKIVSNSI